tara:strand:+ start:50 stop:748 length:699 start_codon:yes stop_codon:yes gene_type:complete
MVQISRKDLERMAIAFGIADFFSGGKLTAPIGNAARKALVKAAPAIGRGILRYGPTVALTAARVTPTPLAAAAVGAAAIQNRRRIADAAGNIYEEVAPAVQQYGAGVVERALDPETYVSPRAFPGPMAGDILLEGITKGRKRKKTKFNQAVSKGMSIIKDSVSFGKKGTINNAKKAFSTVTKVASGVSKGRKAPKSGIRRKLHTAMAKILPKKKKTAPKRKKIDIRVRGRDY